jgi:hypothetical protein
MVLGYATHHCIAFVACLVIVAVVVAFGRNPGADRMSWAYDIGTVPLYRGLFLVLILVIASYNDLFPVALLLVLLFLLINTMVPMLTNLNEHFVFGSPLTACDAYNQASVQRVGTPFYPLNNEGGGGNTDFDASQVPGGDGYDARVAAA